ncbi:MATE family efflux transporter [Capsulimonas corticalis]|uniref:Probable multidrug resistance protein NorM n=1 Tax=Capsulimonas corticalis TaxID=2219043 RepID=A0A402CV32_9BACT|nr:MATE family efflux transporter [Capsulimonas corticalis]BDI30268.1 MATE family efflux transporter [Capsulimonas corticalis]
MIIEEQDERDAAFAPENRSAEPPASPEVPLAVIERESHGSLHRAVWMLAWPSVVTMLLQTLNSFLDRFFVGSLGPDTLAAVGSGGMLMFMLFSVGMSISIGATALVARFTGAGERDEASMAANQSLWIAGVASIACIALMWPLRSVLVTLLGVDAHAHQLCIQYITIALIGVPALFLMLILGGVFRGLGDTLTPLYVMIGINVIHLGGDYLLIFGHNGFPRLGLAGGAIALVSSQVIGALLYLLALRKSVLPGVLSRARRPHWDWAQRILRIGVPAALQNLSRVVSMLAFTGVLARTGDGTAAVAALTIGLTSESIAFMPGFAFSTAAGTLTGQNLGAKNPDRAERAAWVALQQGLAIMIVMGAVFYAFALQFAHIFTHDPAVVRLTVAYLRISALSEPFLAFGMILTGALNGAGDTKAPAWASIITMWAIRLPLAYCAAHLWGFGAVGAWWAMASSTIAGGIAAYTLFKWGRWKKVRV